MSVCLFRLCLCAVVVIMNRCLEEGAEEFFLKPVRLADLNKLKPHMMKTKLKNQKLEEIETPSKDESGTVAAVVEPEVKNLTEIWIKILPLQSEVEPKQIYLQVVQQEEQTVSNNKRKSVEEGLSTHRSRPRFEGIATAVWFYRHDASFFGISILEFCRNASAGTIHDSSRECRGGWWWCMGMMFIFTSVNHQWLIIQSQFCSLFF